MTPLDIAALVAVPAALCGVMAAISALGWEAELKRKATHFAMGCATLSFPWLFSGPLPVVALAGICGAVLLASRALPRWRQTCGTALHGVGRPSLGEFYFVAAVALVFALSGGDPLRYGIPVAVLTVADAAAALVGTRFGRARFKSRDGTKSAEGCVSFAFAAFACAALPLLLWAEAEVAAALLAALMIAALATLIEGACTGGADNLWIPVGVWFLLDRYLDMPAAHMAVRALILALLVAFVLVARRRAALDGGALLGAALLGYGAWALGGLAFLAPLIAIFLCHLAAMRRFKDAHQTNDVFSVAALAITCLIWLTARDATGGSGDDFLAPYLVGAMAQLALMNRATLAALGAWPPPALRAARAGLNGALGAGLPGIAFAADPRALLWALPAGWLAAFAAAWLGHYERPDSAMRFAHRCLLASALAALAHTISNSFR
ncbi:MAG: hypothetical protein R3F11_26255 [Verrucomicrobiales bacterium]